MVDKQNPVEMVDLVLQAGREQPFRLDLADLVLVVEIAQPDRLGALNLGVMLGQRQTALVGRQQFLGTPQDLGIGDAHRLRRLAVARAIDHQHTLRYPDLRCRKPDADRVVHRLEHVVHQPAHRGVDRGNRPRLDLEARIGSGDDRQQSHKA